MCLCTVKVQLMSECSSSIKSVKRVSMILEQGLTGLTADKQSGIDTLSNAEGYEDACPVLVLSESCNKTLHK